MNVDFSQFDAEHPGALAGEPTNPYDSTALVVLGWHRSEDTLMPVGYVPKAHKHWLASISPKLWGDTPDFRLALITDVAPWKLAIWMPEAWQGGYFDFNQGDAVVTQRGGYEDARNRNLWLSGFQAARQHAELHPEMA